MELWIDHPSEPDELILAWQAPDSVEDRRRWSVGLLRKTPEGANFRYFDADEVASFNGGRSQAELKSCGFAGYPAFDVARQPPGGFTSGVLEAFGRRLPPHSRPDFGKFLEHHRFRGEPTISLMSLLALTEAKLPSDGFSLIDPLDPHATLAEVVFEVAGHRHHAEGHDFLQVGERLDLVREPANAFDPNAVRIEAGGRLIGYVNRLQAPAIRHWLDHREVSTWLIRLNGKPTAPRAFVFVQVRPRQSTLAA